MARITTSNGVETQRVRRAKRGSPALAPLLKHYARRRDKGAAEVYVVGETMAPGRALALMGMEAPILTLQQGRWRRDEEILQRSLQEHVKDFVWGYWLQFQVSLDAMVPLPYDARHNERSPLFQGLFAPGFSGEIS